MEKLEIVIEKLREQDREMVMFLVLPIMRFLMIETTKYGILWKTEKMIFQNLSLFTTKKECILSP